MTVGSRIDSSLGPKITICIRVILLLEYKRTNTNDVSVRVVQRPDVYVLIALHTVCEKPRLRDLAEQRAGITGKRVEERNAVKDDRGQEGGVKPQIGNNDSGNDTQVRDEHCGRSTGHDEQQNNQRWDVRRLPFLEDQMGDLQRN